MKLPNCPWCKTANHVYLEPYRRYFCGTCKRGFDDDGDGDGDFCIDPTRRIQREESRQESVRQRTKRLFTKPNWR